MSKSPSYLILNNIVIPHANLTGLLNDDHTQYPLLVGRSGGQTLIGGTGTTDDLIFRTTSGVGASGSDMVFQVGNNGATEAMRILYDGKVGIGIAIPEYKLHISDATPAIKLTDTGGGSGLITSYDGNLDFYADVGNAVASSNISFLVDYSEKMRINSSGNVGIGTAAQGAKLEVIGGVGGQIRVGDSITDATSKNYSIEGKHYTNAEEPVAILFGTASLGANTLNFGGGSGSLNTATTIKFYTAANTTTVTGTERMRIDSSGKVGIGTAAPTAVLHLKAGTATASTAPLKFTSGTLLTAAEDGVIEYLTNQFYLRNDGLTIFSDSKTILFGAGSDMSIGYDGTSGNIKTDLVAASDLHIDCGTDKTLVLDETVWDDIQFSISNGRVAAANFPDWDTTFTTNTAEYKFDINDYIDLGANEMAHWWKEGTTVKPHLHLTLDGANSSGGNQFAQFTVYIAYADVNEVWTETSLTAEYTIPTGTADMTHLLLSMGDLALTNNLIGSQVKIRVKRIAATGGTEYPNHIFITQLGIHAEADTMGSRTVSAK